MPSLTTAARLRRSIRRMAIGVAGWCVTIGASSGAFGQGEPPSLLPAGDALAPAAQRYVDSPVLGQEEHLAARVFHGVADPAGEALPPRLAAQAAIIEHRLDDPALVDPTVPVEWRAEALLLQGRDAEALTLLEGVESIQGARLRAQCLEWQGKFGEADAALEPFIAALDAGRLTTAADLTEAARGLAMRAYLRGRPGSEFHRILQTTAEVHQRIDRLYWPAKLLEAEILHDKDNIDEAVAALHEVIALNPRCAEAWRLLGEIALGMFDFDSAEQAAARLDALQEYHVLARLLMIEMDLVQNLPDSADQRLDDVLARLPRHRHALALRAATQAIRYDEDGMRNALDDFDALSPGHPWAHYTAGYHLSQNRQYDLAAQVLQEAIDRQPNWPAPRVELGLMLLQSGEDARALDVLRRVKELDPFNVRAAFSLHLLESLASYETVRSEHFAVRFDPKTSDRALAVEMLEPLERVHGEVAAAFQHEPDRPTLIELMPNHSRFAVRITGMPQLHTIAACTGPVIAMESPREGPDHFGPYHWQRVLRHEYVHTVTLSRTRNRIPHWLTEAAAVWQEDAPRDFNTHVLLARSFHQGDLFDLDAINWAFVRPQGPNDRSLAYAQGHWMLEFLIQRYGHEAFIRLLDEYAEGFREDLAMPEALSVSRVAFYDEFLAWAEGEVARWGFSPTPRMDELIEAFRAANPSGPEGEPVPIGPDVIDGWLEAHPNHPDVLRMKIDALRAERRIGPETIPLLERYAAARPVDPLPDQLLAAIHLDSDDPTRAIPHLEALDRFQKYDATYAVELARQYRKRSDFREALRKIERALAIQPFNAEYREMAAAIAIQAGDLATARRHVIALTLIEPGREQHVKRLKALDARIQSGG